MLLRDLIREYTQSRTELPPVPPGAARWPQTHVCPKCKTESGRTAVEQGAMICPGLRPRISAGMRGSASRIRSMPEASRSWTPM